MNLILDKITLPAQRPRVSRERLLDALHESMNSCTSTVICGRTGAGKTMLAADVAARASRRVAWYKVDASEVDLTAFLQYLIASVRQQHPGFGRKTLALASLTISPPDATLLAESFVYEMTMLEGEGQPLLIVIDDLHLLYDAAWIVPFFARLLPLLPREAHMILIGRTLPPAPLWRMRSKQTLCVIDEAALAFTLAEARELFVSYGSRPDGAAQALVETWGRAAALDRAAQVSTEVASEDSLRHHAPSINVGTPHRRGNSRLRLVQEDFSKSSLGAT